MGRVQWEGEKEYAHCVNPVPPPPLPQAAVVYLTAIGVLRVGREGRGEGVSARVSYQRAHLPLPSPQLLAITPSLPTTHTTALLYECMCVEAGTALHSLRP
jgi:hypothetical protein